MKPSSRNTRVGIMQIRVLAHGFAVTTGFLTRHSRRIQQRDEFTFPRLLCIYAQATEDYATVGSMPTAQFVVIRPLNTQTYACARILAVHSSHSSNGIPAAHGSHSAPCVLAPAASQMARARADYSRCADVPYLHRGRCMCQPLCTQGHRSRGGVRDSFMRQAILIPKTAG